MRRERQGFSLIEVLVALAVLALALAALVRAAGIEADSLADERERTLAQWVAANAIAETRLAPGLPTAGRRSGEVEMGGRRWRWQMQIRLANAEGIRRLDVTVLDARDARQVYVLTGFAVP